MKNFLNFIEEDIEAKKTLLETLPVKTKANKKKYNEKIEQILLKYEGYKKSLLKYINTKATKLKIKPESKNIEKLAEEVTTLEHVRFVLNPLNTYVEKLGFDSLLYAINHYSEFQFGDLNKILNDFIDKFELINVKLTRANFNYTCYVEEYMSAFIEVRNKKNGKYEKVAKIFEKIYWLNPHLIEHIELNLRRLIKAYSKQFEKYIEKVQKEVKIKNNIKSYEDCLEKLKQAYLNLKQAEEESITDIITKSENGQIEITDYLSDSKIKNEAYTSLSLDSINLEDKKEMDNFYHNITKLRDNLMEYSNYRQFIPLIMDFKSIYEKQIEVDKKEISNKIKEIDVNIKTKEKELSKINTKINNKSLLGAKKINDEEKKLLKSNSVNIAKELCELYRQHDIKYFEKKVITNLNKAFTISNLLELYYSFDYFKKMAIKNVFKISNYEELITFSENFDLFAMNLNNVIMTGVFIFNKEDVSNVIVKKYRLSKINIVDDDLHMDNIQNLINKIDLLLRNRKIECSETPAESIWFMTKVKQINDKLKNN